MHYIKEFVSKIINKITGIIKRNLDLFGGTIISVILAYIVKWNSERMQTIYTFILMVLLCIGLVRALKRKDNNADIDYENNVDGNEQEDENCETLENDDNDKGKNKEEKKIKKEKKQKDSNLIKKVADSQKPFKAIRLSQDPMCEGEELGKMIKETMKGGKIMKEKFKNFWKKLWGNKLTLLNILSSLAMLVFANYLTFSDMLKGIDFFATNELAFKIAVPIVTAIYTILDIFTTVTKYGFENLTDLEKKAEDKALEKASKLTKEQKEYIKEQIVEVKTEITKVETTLDKVNKVIRNFEMWKSLAEREEGLTISQEKATAYEQAMEKKPIEEKNLVGLEDRLEKLEELLNK